MRQGRGMQIEFRAAKPFCLCFCHRPCATLEVDDASSWRRSPLPSCKVLDHGGVAAAPLLVTFAAAEGCIRTNGVLPHHPSTRCPATTYFLFLHHLQTSKRIYRSSSPMSGCEALIRREVRHLAQLYSSLLAPHIDAVVHDVTSDISLRCLSSFSDAPHGRSNASGDDRLQQLCNGVCGTATALSRCVRNLSENTGELGDIYVDVRARWDCAELIALVQGSSPRAPRQSRSWRICSASCGRSRQRR